MKIYDTVSLCKICYRHIQSSVVKLNSGIYITKECPDHGSETVLMEPDVSFFSNLKKSSKHSAYNFNCCMIEVTDHCNLTCPHCYHIPNNYKKDKSQDQLISQILNWPRGENGIAVALFAGAEPTMRKDLPELTKRIKEECGIEVDYLTNGIRFSDYNFAKKCKEAGVKTIYVGLNHHSYQGKKIHDKQLIGIKNCYDIGIEIGYIGYTLELYDHLPEIMEEINNFPKDLTQMYRVRAGSKIGRTPEELPHYMSENWNKFSVIAKNLEYSWEKVPGDDNLYHVMGVLNGKHIRIIQWPDVNNIDLEQLKTGPWCDFVPGLPITNFVHQVITRDAFINNKLIPLDVVPTKYQYRNLKNEYDVANAHRLTDLY